MNGQSRISVGLDRYDGIVLMVEDEGYELTEELAAHIAEALFEAVRIRKLLCPENLQDA